jgi:hypothetical protein
MLSALTSFLHRLPPALKKTTGSSAKFEPEWRDALDEIGRQLVAMTTESEGEFLSMGEKLQDIHLRVRGLSRLSDATAERLSDNAIAAEMEGLKEIQQCLT